MYRNKVKKSADRYFNKCKQTSTKPTKEGLESFIEEEYKSGVLGFFLWVVIKYIISSLIREFIINNVLEDEEGMISPNPEL